MSMPVIYKKKLEGSRCLGQFLTACQKTLTTISFYRFCFFKIRKVGGRTLNNHQIQSFEARD
jgi:hypothetical protein